MRNTRLLYWPCFPGKVPPDEASPHMSVQAVPKRMPYAEFLDWADGRMLEWVDGRVVEMAPASTQHQDLAGFLYAVLRLFVEVEGLGVVLPAPYQMKLARSGREPDLLFVAEAHRARVRRVHLDGPADLAVEIVSPESKRRDRVEKRVEYEEAGIPEYWLVDPERMALTLFQLGDDGCYRAAEPDAHGRLHSRVLPGFWLDPDWLWREPLPPVREILRQLGALE